MRRLVSLLGTLLIVGGLGAVAWGLVVWRWQDPFTALYTAYEQRQLESRYEERLDRAPVRAAQATSPAQARRRVAADARRYRRQTARGEPIGRLRVPRLGLDVMVINGTQTEDLKRGPGRYAGVGSFMPGEGELVYIAGHRTTYGAPLSRIDALRRGDPVRIELPYATVEYSITRRRIVDDNYVQALRSQGREELALQACEPRFFADRRYIAYARPVRITPRGGRPYALAGKQAAQRRDASPTS